MVKLSHGESFCDVYRSGRESLSMNALTKKKSLELFFPGKFPTVLSGVHPISVGEVPRLSMCFLHIV